MALRDSQSIRKNLTYLSLDKAAVKVYGNIGYKSGTSYHLRHDVHSTESEYGKVGVAFDPNAQRSMLT